MNDIEITSVAMYSDGEINIDGTLNQTNPPKIVKYRLSSTQIHIRAEVSLKITKVRLLYIPKEETYNQAISSGHHHPYGLSRYSPKV